MLPTASLNRETREAWAVVRMAGSDEFKIVPVNRQMTCTEVLGSTAALPAGRKIE